MDIALEYIRLYGMKLLLAAVVLIIGLWVINWIKRLVRNSFGKSQLDASLSHFLVSLITIGLKVLLAIQVLGIIGVAMTSFIAILGAAGLAIGLALSGTLQNFAGGVMILIFKPFKVGDFIEAQGHTGTVKEIQIFVTILNTPDNKRILLTNGALANSNMTNFSSEPKRRVDWTFGIGYGDHYDKARDLLLKFAGEDEKILQDPAPFVGLSNLGDSSVNIVVRAWVNAPDYWEVFFRMNERVYKEFGEHDLNIPFPQMDVHVHNA